VKGGPSIAGNDAALRGTDREREKHMRYGILTAISLAAAAVIGTGAIAPVEARVIETVLLAFTMGRDGSLPTTGVVVGQNGRIYGATAYNYPAAITLPACIGGHPPACGNVFELTPPAAGKTEWTERVLAYFQPSNDVDGLLIINSPAAERGVYGTTTTVCGSACFSTAASIFGIAQGEGLKTLRYFWHGTFTSSVIGPGLISDATGALYATTAWNQNVLGRPAKGASTIIKLTPPAPGGKAWKSTTLWSSAGTTDDITVVTGPLFIDAKGALYGTTAAATIFKLTPPAAGQTKWTFTTLWRFMSGNGVGLIAEASGALYGTSGSSIFKLTPPAAGKTDWTLTTIWNFAAGYDGSSNPGYNSSSNSG
jgi:hypothetical protein